ncbi:MAG: TIGR01458 family HAD-type hydrolase [Gammaproteobacteria bacterium]|jgi:HAD superfamily hydrolase (TIGR01458 family)|nr:TIGR01458 family HAD-type hydrolase [Gammaproteobacteria bacterium]MCW8942194.1 TIGR01458 family HAD-type hydrolase [Gammaproteobacteria bacterium]
MSAILFDLDGVLYEGDRPIDGAAETISWFNNNRIPHLFLTNTTSKSRSELVHKLSAFAIETKIEDFLTPPVAAKQWLQSNALNRIALFVPESTGEEFSGFDLVSNENSDVDAVVVGDLGVQWTFERMNQVFRTMINNPEAKLIALGMTRYWRANSGLQLDVGPMIKAFEYATGTQAVVTGKPAKAFFEAAVNILGKDENIMMIGDDIRGDIEASQQAGLKAIQVRTGKFISSDLELGITPDVILDSVADLPQWWQSNM